MRGIKMLKAVLMAATLGLAALTCSTPEASAAVVPSLGKATSNLVTPVGWGHHHGFHGVRRFGGFHHHRHFGHRGFFIGAPIYAYGYGDGCGWLRHRAIVTGSSYWWRRYRWCRGW